MGWDDIEDFTAFEVSVQEFVNEHGNPNSFAAWQSGWRVGMSILGFGAAGLEARHEVDEDTGQRRVTYSWCADQDLMIRNFLNHESIDPAGGWDAAHACFVAMEPMRPAYVERSQALDEIIARLNKETN
jgi:hypothetical protein